MTTVLHERPGDVPLAAACRALGMNRSSVYVRRQRATGVPGRTSRKGSTQPRALSDTERSLVLSTLHSEEHCDQPPGEVHALLLERGQYLCSVSTMHRLLRAANEQGDRRPQRAPQRHVMPRLIARAPNEVWTWDITKLATLKRSEYLSLYVVMDLYSRFVVAWMLSRKENSALAQQLMAEALLRYRVAPGQLTVHQDRGAPMIAHAYLDLMSELGATCSHSRPRVSNDNPFSESQFKTQKYQPDYPGRFDHYAHARTWCESYFDWYNFSHHHSGLAMYTPEQVFTGRHKEIAAVRQQTLNEHYRQYPERFVGGAPVAAMPPAVVAINPECQENGTGLPALVNFPTLPAAIERKSMMTSR